MLSSRAAARSCVVLAGLLASTTLSAQPSAQSGASTPDAQPEIIVTARRRAENVETVPIAISAIGGAQITQRSIFSENDLQTAVPGVTIRQNGGVNAFNYVIRGQLIDTYSNSPPSVLPYTNEVPIVTHSASTFYDMEGIQVLKGPQGTLFGRNATGGAVLFETAKPGDTLGGYVSARYGSYASRNVQGAITVPISDAVSLRAAGSYTGGGAYVKDVFVDRSYGALDQKSGRLSLRIKPAPDFVNTTVFQYTDEGGTNTPHEVFSIYPIGSGFNSNAASFYDPASVAFALFRAAHPNLFQGGVTAFAALQKQLGPWRAALNLSPAHDARSTYLINTTRWDISPDLTIKNIFGYNHSRSHDAYDYDGTPYPIAQTGGTFSADGTRMTNIQPYAQFTRQYSEELQVQGKAFDRRLDYVIGFYYLQQRDEIDSNNDFFDFSPIADGTVARYHQRSDDRSIAGFAQATYRITDKLNLTGGFRYTEDRQQAVQLPGSLFGVGSPEQASFSKPSWTVSLDYRVMPSLMLYVAHRGSWRTGAFNFTVTPIPSVASQGGNLFLPDTTEDVEVGAKYSGDELGVPVTLNVDVYNQWVHNSQRAAYILGVGGTVSIATVNVPQVQVTGVEADLSVRPTRHLQLGASGAYTNARYTNGRLTVLGDALSYGPYANSPKWTGTLFADASAPLGGDHGELHLRVDAYAQTSLEMSNVAATRAPLTTLPGYALVNARLSWSKAFGTPLTAAIFVRNLGNRRYYLGGNAPGPTIGYNTVNPGMPRMIGGELRLDF